MEGIGIIWVVAMARRADTLGWTYPSIPNPLFAITTKERYFCLSKLGVNLTIF